MAFLPEMAFRKDWNFSKGAEAMGALWTPFCLGPSFWLRVCFQACI